MRDERGQASIEWIGAVLMLALTLAGLARLAGEAEPQALASDLIRTSRCAVAGCEVPANPSGADPSGGDPSGADPSGADRSRRAFVIPPLLPLAPDARGRRRPTAGRVPRTGEFARRARRPLGRLWRRAWLVCFGYERLRYGLLHPETRPRQTVPIRGALQMVNDCASPVDFARDWELIRPR